MSQSTMQRGCFAVFKANIRAKAQLIKLWLSAISSELLILLQPNFGFMAHHHKLDCLVKRLHCCVVLKVKVTAKVKNVIDISC